MFIMKTEYEVRLLDIEFDDMIQKVKSYGATQLGIYYQKRYVYDFIPAQKGRWIRLRTNGYKTTLTIKEIKSLQIDGTKELEIVVSDFDNTYEILKKLGYIPRSFQENFRIEYKLDDVILDFDKWPMISPYLEIEGNSKQSVLKMLSRLGVDCTHVTTMDVDTLYNSKHGIRLDTIENLSFNQEELQFIGKYLNIGGNVLCTFN